MKKDETPKPTKGIDEANGKNAEGYPLYPPGEDIYNKFREVKDIDPEDIEKYNGTATIPHTEELDLNELDKSDINEIDKDEMDELKDEENQEYEEEDIQEFADDESDELKQAGIKELGDDLMGIDLDVPGADLDDEAEEIGSEDEENNYYSIGGDKHKDLEEDTGEINDEDE